MKLYDAAQKQDAKAKPAPSPNKPRERAGKPQRPKKASAPAPVEVTRTGKRGRPPGPEVQMLSIGLPPALVTRVDAAKAGRTRTETIRVLLEEALK